MSTHAPTAFRRKLHLVRHGQTEWNAQGRWQGHLGGRLTPEGIQQAERVANEISQHPVDIVYCSDLERAVLTAQRISAACKAAVIQDQRLREICLGEWEGSLGEDLRRNHPEQFEERKKFPITFRAPQGESLLDVRDRLQSWISDIQISPYSHIVVVSHAVTLSVLRAEMEGGSMESAYDSHLTNCESYVCTLPSGPTSKNSGVLV
jgi:probable phosphoglycerate mutase